MRALVPADSLVYLETNDLAGALQPIIDSKPFNEVAKYKPDLSPLKGVQLAVAVTGFETSEEKVNDEQSIGKIQPRFVAVADTHAWNFQAVGFAEQKLGSFVAKIYDSEPTLENEKNGGKYFTWTAADGRKAYALVIDAVIYFGNDETSIDKCLAVKRGESDSIIKTGKVQRADPQTLATGYVGPDGIAQIANIVGLKFAAEAADDPEIQSAIAGIVPKLLRNSITEIHWNAAENGRRMEDKYTIITSSELAKVFSESIAAAPTPDPEDLVFNVESQMAFDVLQLEPATLTVYNLKNPRAAWQAFIKAVQQQTGIANDGIFHKFLLAFLEPYGIRDPEQFLSQAKSPVITGNCSQNDDQPFVLLKYTNVATVNQSLVDDLELKKKWPGMVRKPIPPIGKDVSTGSSLLASEDKEVGAFFRGNTIAIGDLVCIETLGTKFGPLATDVMIDNRLPETLLKNDVPIITVGKNKDLAIPIADLLSALKPNAESTAWSYTIETRVSKSGIERRTVSDFGLIGSIIAQLGQD